ncbi:MAG: hypothetical protein Nk1A_9020 [Endomicrobiia bacterium]|nr:MAG: hypothetical protein Nk1A_9020 [Endomicrobiia bacterium]
MKTYGLVRGNMKYSLDNWYVEIKPLNYMFKQETMNMPLIISRVPNYNLSGYDNPNEYPAGLAGLLPALAPKAFPFSSGYTDNKGVWHYVRLLNQGVIPSKYTSYTDTWGTRKEAKLRDKYIKIKVRYSGKDLAVISAIKTLYTVSYG